MLFRRTDRQTSNQPIHDACYQRPIIKKPGSSVMTVAPKGNIQAAGSSNSLSADPRALCCCCQVHGGWKGSDEFGSGNAVPRPVPGCGRFLAINAARDPMADDHWQANQQHFKRSASCPTLPYSDCHLKPDRASLGHSWTWTHAFLRGSLKNGCRLTNTSRSRGHLSDHSLPCCNLFDLELTSRLFMEQLQNSAAGLSAQQEASRTTPPSSKQHTWNESLARGRLTKAGSGHPRFAAVDALAQAQIQCT